MKCNEATLASLKADFTSEAKAYEGMPGIIKFLTNGDNEAEDYARYATLVGEAEESVANKQSGALSRLSQIREEFNMKKQLLDAAKVEPFSFLFGAMASPETLGKETGRAAEYSGYIQKLDCVIASL